MEMDEMHQSMTGFISIILLLLGSILMLAIGLGLISSNYVLVAVLVCFISSVLFIDGVLKKLFMKSNQVPAVKGIKKAPI
jgi:hypothetical protein